MTPATSNRDSRPKSAWRASSQQGSKCASDFVYELTPNANKAPEVFDPVPCLVAANWHMRNPHKTFGLFIPKSVFHLIKMGRLSLADVRLNMHLCKYTALAQYNDRSERQRHPSIVVPPNRSMPTPSQPVKLRLQAGLCNHPDDVTDGEFLGYDPTGLSDDEGEGGAPRNVFAIDYLKDHIPTVSDFKVRWDNASSDIKKVSNQSPTGR